MSIRMTFQDLLPATRPSPPADAYDLYPAFPAAGEFHAGFEDLARVLARQRRAAAGKLR